jgi:prepilin-type N-terminal cleavage/methylation domain-containing protein
MRRVGYKTKLGKRRFEIGHSELPGRNDRTHYSELLSKNKGFTLIEIVIVIVILSLISAISIKFVVDSLRIYTMTINQKILFDEGKLALERMVRDIRDARAMAEPDTGETVSDVRITRTNATAQDVAGEAIRFVLSGNTLQKRKSDPSAMFIDLASNVSTFTATRGTTADITIVLTLSLATGENVTLRTRVYLKNFADNTAYRYYFQNWQEEISS